jgi:hypothetical protein
MNSNLKRLAAVAAVSAAGILAPVASANAAVTGPIILDGPGSLSFIGPTAWPGAFAVIGPTVYTVGGGNVFVGTTITTTAGGAAVGTGPAG